MINLAPIRARFASLFQHLDERGRRLFAATEALAAGYGGIAAVVQATGIAASTIGRGLKELAGETAAGPGRVRRAGAAGGWRAQNVDFTVTVSVERSADLGRAQRSRRPDVTPSLDL